MDLGPDELAGAVDCFGGLTREELTGVLVDLAARSGDTLVRDRLDRTIDEAIDGYYLIEVDAERVGVGGVDSSLLLAGPAALPRLPERGEDLPHLLALDPRHVDRETVANHVERRLRADAAAAIAAADGARARALLDACYEVESWGPVDLDDAKVGLADLLE